MKTGSITKKIIGGKLVRIDITFDDHIQNAKLTGDFFLHPEDTLEDIVNVLEGASIPIQSNVLQKAIEAVLKKNEAQLIGANAEDIISILEEAVACASE